MDLGSSYNEGSRQSRFRLLQLVIRGCLLFSFVFFLCIFLSLGSEVGVRKLKPNLEKSTFCKKY